MVCVDDGIVIELNAGDLFELLPNDHIACDAFADRASELRADAIAVDRVTEPFELVRFADSRKTRPVHIVPPPEARRSSPRLGHLLATNRDDDRKTQWIAAIALAVSAFVVGRWSTRMTTPHRDALAASITSAASTSDDSPQSERATR